MRPNMKDLLLKTAGTTRTENGAVTNISTGNDVLNLFALGGAVRNRSIQDVVNLVDAAWREDQDLALRVIFYLGDVRGGQGERDFFFNALRYLAVKAPAIARKVLILIPEYSRWDMAFAFIGTPIEKDALRFLKFQFEKDLEAERPTLLAKWLPSPGTASQKALSVLVARAFGLELGAYRKLRAMLNRRIDTVEVKMSARQWEDIDFEKVPGKAFMNYQKAFERHGYQKMQKFVEQIQKGEVKVKSETLYPHEIVRKSLGANGTEEITLQSAWDNLPNYIKDGRQGIAVIDTSGSMTGIHSGRTVEPILVAKSLGMYLSERLSGPYKDHYITFSEQPIMAKFHGANIASRYRNMREIVASTNIEAVYDLILEVAVRNNLPQSEVPSHLYIFSDMEFNEATSNGWGSRRCATPSLTLYQTIQKKYSAYGYTMPVTIFWNLDARNNQHPVTQHESGAALVSGFSPSTFQYIMEGVILTPYQTMMKVLDAPRYALLSELFE